MSIAVCIPTMRRFSFLQESIPKYLANPYVNELIICDETGEDYLAITSAFSHPKLRVYQNERRLGSMFNKQRVASYATSDFISIMDSDNFADISYFEAFRRYIACTPSSKTTLYLPCASNPSFSHHRFIGKTITKNTVGKMYPDIDLCLNTMNMIVSREFLSQFKIENDKPFCDEASGAHDALYFSLYALFNMGATLVVIPGMEYEHRVHAGSFYLEMAEACKPFLGKLMDRYFTTNTTTLLEWQSFEKPSSDLIVQASSVDGDDAWMPFPIGMHYLFKEPIENGAHSKTVFCGISANTDEVRRSSGKNRRGILNTLLANGIVNTVVSSRTYYSTLASYKFVVSPEGNGIDCHRHYEALMHGCIPIIERNGLIETKYRGCPVLYTDDYSEITEEYLVHKYEEMKRQLYDFTCLNIHSYDQSIQDQIKKCGNFWMKRLTSKNWYKVGSLSVDLIGGLGNQLFQLAALHSLSRKSNRELYLPLNIPQTPHSSTQYFDTIFQSWKPFYKDIREDRRISDPVSVRNGYPAPANYSFTGGYVFDYLNRELKGTDVAKLFGYFQDYHLVDPDFSKLLHFSEECLGRHQDISTKIFLHFRGGDYTTIPDLYVNLNSYYERAIAMFPNVQFAVFTNDVPLLQKCSWLKTISYELIEENEIDSLFLMSRCAGGICANSTFSWWGAFLNRARKLVVPSKWMNNPNHIIDGYYFPEAIRCEV